MSDLFSAEDIVVRFTTATLLQASLTLTSGELLIVSGPSGCGKSSLLRLLSGLDPTSGTLLLDGQSPAEHTWPVWRRQINYLPQQPRLFPGTVRHNLELPFRYRSARAPFDAAYAQQLLETLELNVLWETHEVNQLSVGEQQRVCIARALLLNPKVLLLDEPTASLDPQRVRRVETLLANWVRQQPRAALIVSHDPEQALRWGTRRLEVSEGRLHPPVAPGVPVAHGSAHV